MPCLDIKLLGDFRLLYDEMPVTTLNTPRLQTLLAYLVLHQEAPQARQRLAFLFWPDTTEAQARTNLRNLLYHLKRVLPDGHFVDSDRQTLQWRPDQPFTADVMTFEGALAQARAARNVDEELEPLNRAVDLYRGDLLPDCYDDWILPIRERLREAYSGALARLVQLAENQHRYLDAIHYARRMLLHDPLQEATYRRLMRLYALNQDPAGAQQIYHTCVTTLQRELGVEPSPVTRQTYEQLLNLETLPEKQPLSPSIPLVGRSDEWESLLRHWRNISRSGPKLVIINGEAGIGKTRLAEELFVWTARQGVASLQAHCYATAGRLAYAPITDWLRSLPVLETVKTLDPIWLSELTRLRPELLRQVPGLLPPEPLTEDWQRQRLHEALARGLLTTPQPFLLFIDNLQWADPKTLTWLHFLLRYKIEARFLIVGTSRVEEVMPGHPLEKLRLDLQSLGLLHEITLGALDEATTADLASRISGYPLNPTDQAQIYQKTEGNPLFIVEMARTGPSSVEVYSPRLQAVVEARLNLLSPEAGELAGLAATIGRDFTLNVLSEASPLGEDQLVQALDELWTRRIIREQGQEAYDFSHERLREVAYLRQSGARRQLNHRRIATALATVFADERGSVAEQIGIHQEAAGQIKEAAQQYQAAAEAARQLYANQEAIGLYQRALAALKESIYEPGSKEAKWIVELHESLGEVLQLAGDFEAARAEYLAGIALIGRSDAIRQAELQWKIGETWRQAYHPVEALAHYQAAEDSLEGELDRSPAWWQLWIEIQQARAWVAYRLSKLEEMQARVEAIRDIVQKHGSPHQRAIYHNFLIATSNLRERFVVSDKEVGHAEASLAARMEIGNPVEIAQARFSLGFELLWYGDLDKAEENLLQALHTFDKVGYRLMQSRTLAYLTILYRLQGDEAALREYNTSNLTIAREINMPDYLGIALAQSAWLAYRQGDLESTEQLCQEALDTWSQGPPYPIQWVALWPALAVAFQRQQLDVALEYARKLLSNDQQRLPDDVTNNLEKVDRAGRRSQETALNRHLKAAVQYAQEHGYL